MQYIKKLIELDTSGHFNECWECDFKSVNLIDLPNILIDMLGTRTYADKVAGKHSADKRLIMTTSIDLQLNGSIGYENISTLYTILTTKTKTEIYYESKIITAEDVANGSPYVEGAAIEIEKTRTVPVYPDFFGGEIIDIQE